MAYGRDELRKWTPSWYRWWLHAGLIGLSCAVAAVFVWGRIGSFGPGEGVLFVTSLVLANLGEWAVHRYQLHVPRFPKIIYHRHTPCHHGFFTYERMAIDDLRDFHWVLFPPWAIAGILVGVLPVAGILGIVFSTDAARVFVLAVIVYYATYEFFHALAHLPHDHWLAGTRFARAVTHHHRVHHDPQLMRRWNFNFAVPAFDWLFGTLYPGDSLESGREPAFHSRLEKEGSRR